MSRLAAHIIAPIDDAIAAAVWKTWLWVSNMAEHCARDDAIAVPG